MAHIRALEEREWIFRTRLYKQIIQNWGAGGGTAQWLASFWLKYSSSTQNTKFLLNSQGYNQFTFWPYCQLQKQFCPCSIFFIVMSLNGQRVILAYQRAWVQSPVLPKLEWAFNPTHYRGETWVRTSSSSCLNQLQTHLCYFRLSQKKEAGFSAFILALFCISTIYRGYGSVVKHLPTMHKPRQAGTFAHVI